MTLRDFTIDLRRWHLVDCFECDNRSSMVTDAAWTWISPLPCPACERSDWHADDAAAGWAEQ